MARKNLLAHITATIGEDAERGANSDTEARASYTRRGASRSMIQSLDELAETSMRILDGDTVIALDPGELDGSFVADRIGDDDEAYSNLKEAIRQSGQSTPILVRPHPSDDGRYMIVFGHRRARVARELGVKVRAVVKPLADIEHVIAQGQENTARADLTFIEKAIFASKLLRSGLSKDVLKSALTVDDSLLSRMLSVADVVPDVVLDALGSAKGVGRDRWEELKKLVLNPAAVARARELVQDEMFISQTTDETRFQHLVVALKAAQKAGKRAKQKSAPAAWMPADQSVSVVARQKPNSLVMEFGNPKGKSFGKWLSGNMDSLFEQYSKANEEQETGD
ncbi:chromosome partitioning protein, ParB family [Rhizobium tibeticum]|uniref:Chromosome partitioning protein, ParB family n=1 Tax=Rhizobium tibeticum TaxID=501024 RepID=A0A1H8WLG0_9HYPH|nr:plasmid partitioning protein RepB [Rhizobium tibeticum]SEI21247.1 Chromosome-partitioning protein ParB [Rhizobium tibeticum]SEP28491.1 chromosome partitioning protein, ParB family [Rhizobium tibeticum]